MSKALPLIYYRVNKCLVKKDAMFVSWETEVFPPNQLWKETRENSGTPIYSVCGSNHDCEKPGC